MTELILASGSPRRKSILASRGIKFKIIPANVNEKVSFCSETCAIDNAVLKAENVSEQYPDSLVLAADTVVELENEIIGKPADEADALNILMRLSGKTHTVTTGVALFCKNRNIKCVFADCSNVSFLPFSAETAKEYMSKVNVLDKAGAYAGQEFSEMIISKIEGDFSNVIGLPERVFPAIENCMKLIEGTGKE